ncbi:MAG: hypothetical protein RL681_413 [Candidatus Parcubacteria bacterium]
MKKAAKKTAGRKSPTKAGAIKAQPEGKPLGAVTHFYNHIGVAIVKFKKPVKSGIRLRFHGATTDFEETVKSMQFDHKPIAVAPKGKQIGIKLGKRVREGDAVYEA